MSAEVLRRAASLMRERAEAAGVQPWASNDAMCRNPLSEVGTTYIRHEVRGPHKGEDWPFIAEANATQYAEHIAAADPPFMLAVADWLDHVAYCLEFGSIGPTSERHALAVARAYLGGAS